MLKSHYHGNNHEEMGGFPATLAGALAPFPAHGAYSAHGQDQPNVRGSAGGLPTRRKRRCLAEMAMAMSPEPGILR